MRKEITIFSLSLLIISCSKSKDEQLKINIKDFILKKLDDPKSYESVDFGKLDSTYTTFNDTPEFEELKSKENDLQIKFDSLDRVLDREDLSINQLKQIQIENEKIKNERVLIVDKQTKASLNYNGVFNGFVIDHKFRAKNKMGALVLDSCTIYLDKNLKVKSIF